MATPTPGRPVRGSASGRPVMALLDLLGRRWTLRIGWELRNGPMGFRELQRRCSMVSADPERVSACVVKCHGSSCLCRLRPV